MIRLHHDRARQHFAAHEKTIDAGVSQLAETFAIEATETVAQAIPGRIADGMAKRRVEAALRPRIADALVYLHTIDDGPATTNRSQPAMDQQTLATIGAIGLPIAWLLTKLPWAKLWQKLPDITPEPAPVAPLTEADFLPGDYAALERLKDRATRFGNAEMWAALETVEAQFMLHGEGWEGAE